MDKFLDTAVKAARGAGSFLLERLDSIKEVSYKDREHKNPISSADKGAERIIIDIISNAFPDHSFISEEWGKGGKTSEYRWIIDPLDGTVNYLHGHKYFCVSVALAYRDEAIAGAVYNPVTNEMFSASKDAGAYCNDRKIHVSETAKLNESLVGVSFPYGHNTEAFDASVRYFARLSADAQAVRRDGSTALSLCNVACGRYDGFFVVENKVWDYAAGALLVTEAGGRVTDLRSRAIRLKNDSGRLMATNGAIHKAMFARFKEEGII